jgi:UDP-N-acetylglucosamine--N-acetylmuramyl-(pentapeptide) pyrophosphoryl-undecaprenol N-acetylglucosamine transferase
MNMIFTGGGTLGPVTPLLAVIEELKALDPKIEPVWVGTRKGVERRFVSEKGIAYRWIPSGKLRRYFDLRNILAPFLMLAGFIKSLFLILALRPKAVVGAGGFVQVPLMYAAKIFGVPVFVHQQDLEAGLANRLGAAVATAITAAFPEAQKQFKKTVEIVGNPCRRLVADLVDPAVRARAKDRGMKRWGFDPSKQTVLVLGGGTGAAELNEQVARNLGEFEEQANVLHLTGRGKSVGIKPARNYVAVEFLNEEMAEAYAAADLVVCRAGMGTLTEIGVLGLPAVLLPLAGHQEKNAAYFSERGAAMSLYGKIVPRVFADMVLRLLNDRDRRLALSRAISDLFPADAASKLAKIIIENIK